MYGLANQKLCYVQMRRNTEKSGEQDWEHSKEWLVNTDQSSLIWRQQRQISYQRKAFAISMLHGLIFLDQIFCFHKNFLRFICMHFW